MKVFIKNSRYLTLFLALIIMIFLSPFLAVTYFGKWLTTVFFILLLIAIVFTTLENRRHFILACLAAATVLLLYALALLTGNQLLHLLQLGFGLLLFIAVLAMIFRELVLPSKITANTVYAALSVYFLLGLIYANAYKILELVVPGSFAFNTDILSGSVLDQFTLSYFSFTTLTTVGFGEIIPTTTFARAIVILEQTSGVLYLAVIVARLVSGLKYYYADK